jgi:hypothetical protein
MGARMELEATKARLIGACEKRREFVTFEDGYVYFWPGNGMHGALPAWALRALADELDRRNAPWDAQIEQYHRENGSEPADHVDDIRPPDRLSEGLRCTKMGDLLDGSESDVGPSKVG